MTVVEFNKYHQAKTRAKERAAELMDYLEENISTCVFVRDGAKGDTLEEQIEDRGR